MKVSVRPREDLSLHKSKEVKENTIEKDTVEERLEKQIVQGSQAKPPEQSVQPVQPVQQKPVVEEEIKKAEVPTQYDDSGSGTDGSSDESEEEAEAAGLHIPMEGKCP